MAVIRDVMPAFDLLQPSSISDAEKLLQQHGADAWVMAGGLDSFDWLKDRIKRPKVLVDLSGIEELRGVRATNDGIEIGAMTTLTEVVSNPLVKQHYGLLAQERRAPPAFAANPESGHPWRQRNAGRPVLVLPRGLAVLSRWWQHLLCRYSRRTQPRARDSSRRTLRCRESVRFRSGTDRTGREICDTHREGRARSGCRRLFRWPRN